MISKVIILQREQVVMLKYVFIKLFMAQDLNPNLILCHITKMSTLYINWTLLSITKVSMNM